MSQDISMSQSQEPLTPITARSLPSANDGTYDGDLLRALKLHANYSSQAKLRNHGHPMGLNPNVQHVTDQRLSFKRDAIEEGGKLRGLVDEEQEKIKQLRASLSSLKASSHVSPAEQKRIHLRALRAANESTFDTVYYIPSASSPLNHALAARNVARVIRQTRETIAYHNTNITNDKETLKLLSDAADTAEELRTALQARVDELEELTSEIRDDADEEKRDKELEARLLKEQDAKIKELGKKSRAMMREVKKFIEENLSYMLAVEEMGGPVAGMEQDVDVLKTIIEGEAGLDGKVKGKGGKGKKAVLRGQKRIDEIWGKKPRDRGAAEGEDEEEEAEEDDTPVDPAQAAGKELMDLVETLMNNAISDASTTYTTLPRDSAAGRYLVRTYVAQLHPNNARKLRLIEFGRGIEDG